MNPMDETRTAGKSDTPYIISAWNFPADISITGNDITRIMFGTDQMPGTSGTYSPPRHCQQCSRHPSDL